MALYSLSCLAIHPSAGEGGPGHPMCAHVVVCNARPHHPPLLPCFFLLSNPLQSDTYTAIAFFPNLIPTSFSLSLSFLFLSHFMSLIYDVYLVVRLMSCTRPNGNGTNRRARMLLGWQKCTRRHVFLKSLMALFVVSLLLNWPIEQAAFRSEAHAYT